MPLCQDSVLSHEGCRSLTPILAVQVYFIVPFHHDTKPNHWFSFLSIKYIFSTRFFQLGLTGLYLSFQIKASFRQFKIWKFRICQRKAEIIASKYYATGAVRIITDISYSPAGKAAATVLSTTWLFQDCRCLAVPAPKTRCIEEHLGKLFLFSSKWSTLQHKGLGASRNLSRMSCTNFKQFWVYDYSRNWIVLLLQFGI